MVSLRGRPGRGRVTVAIDGPAGTGKSTVAREVARRTRFRYVNSGNLYRAITVAVLERGIDPSAPRAIEEAARRLRLDEQADGVTVDGRLLGEELRSPAVDAAVADLSAIPGVRAVVNERLRRIARSTDMVVEGRDMTTVVFPDAEIRVYLDASLEVRAARRHRQRNGGDSIQDVTAQIVRRDTIDTTKPVGRLKLDPSALYIDSSHLTVDQVCDMVVHEIRTYCNSTGATGPS